MEGLVTVLGAGGELPQATDQTRRERQYVARVRLPNIEDKGTPDGQNAPSSAVVAVSSAKQ
jgi:hypothetical protein